MALYDGIADQYDATRGYPPGVAAVIAHRLREVGGEYVPEQGYIEIGAGSGRNGVPLAALGVDYTGVDESRAMLGYFAAHLREVAAPRAKLVQADAKRLPFAAASFAVGLAVHVFHLVGGWQQAADELRRVVKRGGKLLLGFDLEAADTPYAAAIRQWNRILDGKGVPHTVHSREEVGVQVKDYLISKGATMQQETLHLWQSQPTAAQMWHDYRFGGFCRTLDLPAAVFDAYAATLKAWLVSQHGSLDAPLLRRQRFDVYVVRLP